MGTKSKCLTKGSRKCLRRELISLFTIYYHMLKIYYHMLILMLSVKQKCESRQSTDITLKIYGKNNRKGHNRK